MDSKMNFVQHVFDQANPGNRFLDEMNKVVPWQLFERELSASIHRKSGGRPPYPLLLLFKMHLLQVWFALSDAACEHQVKDRLSFRQFLGLAIDDKVPDSTTLENFRHDFATIAEQVLTKLDAFFKTEGLLLKAGNVVDATFIQANSRQYQNPLQGDPDAEWGYKGYGYSATANVDVQSKIIRKVYTSSARPHDSQMLEASLLGDERVLYADSAYAGFRHRLAGIKTRILYKRQRGKKGEVTPTLSSRQKGLNVAYAKIRARVEHVFAAWKLRIRRAWYRGLERVNQQLQSMALAYNLRRYGFICRA